MGSGGQCRPAPTRAARRIPEGAEPYKRDRQVPLAPATAARYPHRMSSSPSFELRRVDKPKPRPKDSELVFGRTFTDHMAIVDYDAERGWFDPRVVPYGPLALDPAAAVFHYAQ